MSCLITFAGMPTAIVFAGIFPFTIELEPIMHPSPISAPFMIFVSGAIQTWFPMTTGLGGFILIPSLLYIGCESDVLMMIVLDNMQSSPKWMCILSS